MCKVSVIIPVYNVEQYLYKCLESVVNQTLEDIEIICVNDGSTDKSLDTLHEFAQKDSRIKVFSQTNQGQSVAKNRGMQYAAGEYIFFCDSDDYVEENALEKLYRKAKEYNLDILRFNGYDVGKDESINDTIYFFEQFDRVLSGQEALECYKEVPPVCWLLFIKKQYLEQFHIGFIEGIVREDHAFFIELYAEAARVYQSKEFLYWHMERNDSTMGRLDWDYMRSIESFEISIQVLCERKKTILIQNACFDKILELLLEIYVYMPYGKFWKTRKKRKTFLGMCKEYQYFNNKKMKALAQWGMLFCLLERLRRKELRKVIQRKIKLWK